MTEKEALKLARRALWFAHDDGYSNELSQEALASIKEALAQQNEFKPDWDEKLALTEEVIRLSKRIEELEAQPEQEPWPDEPVGHIAGGVHPPHRKPLSDEEIWEALGGIDCTRPMLIAQAIEAAHGIKGEA